MALISKIKGTDNVDYNVRDDVSVWGGRNLFRLSNMQDRSTFISNGTATFDDGSYFRYYNGAVSNHTFEQIAGGNGYQDTILLNSAANIGIAFMRPVSEFNFNSNSYYTMSCWAKTTKTSAGLDMGLSYRTNADAWVWRGGSNRHLFNTTNTWQHFSLTFKPDADTKIIMYCFTVLGVTNGTDTFTIKHCKLEKGTKPTDWSPAPEDIAHVNGECLELLS